MTHLERSRHQQFPFHLVAPSPWPIVVSFALMSLALSLALTMHGYIGHMYLIYLSILTVTLSATLWFRDIIAEATYLGDHTIAVRKGINLGFLLFVVSEILIFAALFWAYFHSAMSPNIELGWCITSSWYSSCTTYRITFIKYYYLIIFRCYYYI